MFNPGQALLMSDNAILERPLTTNPKIDLYDKEDIINRLAKGEAQQSIATDHKITQTAVSILKSNNKHLVESKKQELLAKLPSVVEIVTKDLTTNHQLSNDLHNNLDSLTIENKLQLKTILDRTSVNILKIAGIFPSQALINYNLNQDNRTQTVTVSDNVLNLFAPHAKELIDTAIVSPCEEVVGAEGVSDSNGNDDNVDNSG